MELQAWNGERIWQAVLTRSCPQASFHFQVPALTLLYTTRTAVGGLRCPPLRKPPSFRLRTPRALNSGRNDRLYRNPHAIEAHVVHTHLLILWLAMVFAVSSVSTVWPELT